MSEEQGGETTRRKRKSGWATTEASSNTQQLLPQENNSDSNSNSSSSSSSDSNSSSSSNSSNADSQQYIPAAQVTSSSSMLSTIDQQKLEQLRLIAEQKAASLQQNYLQKQLVAGVSNPIMVPTAAMTTPSSVVPGSGALLGLSAIPLAQPSKMSKEQKIDNRIYVGSLYYELTEADIKTLFGSFGTITHIEMPLDPITRKSRGYCFVEFLTEDEATQAQVQMNGFIVAGRPIKTNKPYNNGLLGSLGGGGGAPGTASSSSSSSSGQANPTFAMANQIKGGHAANPNNFNNFNNPAVSMLPLPALSPQNTIIIRNIHSSITLSQIMTIFDKFGEITTLSWSPSALPSTKTALIHFESPNVASAAATTFNNYEMFPGFPFIIEQPSIPNQNALPKMMMAAPASLHVPAVSSYNSTATTTTVAPVSAVLAPLPQQKCSVLLENMITLEEVDDPLLEGEVREEGEKFGLVKKIAITTTTQGNNPVIILTYARPEDAALAQSKLHNRPFGGRMVVASLI